MGGCVNKEQKKTETHIGIQPVNRKQKPMSQEPQSCVIVINQASLKLDPSFNVSEDHAEQVPTAQLVEQKQNKGICNTERSCQNSMMIVPPSQALRPSTFFRYNNDPELMFRELGDENLDKLFMNSVLAVDKSITNKHSNFNVNVLTHADALTDKQ